MAHLLKKGQERSDAKREQRKSKSGRVINTPRNLLTSEDDAPKIKKSKNSATVNSELEKLRTYVLQKYPERFTAGTSQDIVVDPTGVPENENLQKLRTPHILSEKKINKNAQNKIKDSATMTGNKPVQKIGNNNSLISNIVQNTQDKADDPAGIIEQENKLQKLTNQKQIISRKGDEDNVQIFSKTTDHVEELFIKDTTGTSAEAYSVIDFGVIAKDLKIIRTQNDEIIGTNKEILKKLNEMKRTEMNTKGTLYSHLEGFPLQTISEFIEVDNESEESQKKREQLYEHFLNIGGTKLREFLSMSMKQLMTDNLVCDFTWNGGKGTQKFGDTKISNVLFSSAKKCPFFKGPSSVNEFKTEMREVMRITKQRFRQAARNKHMFNADKATYNELMERVRELENVTFESDEDASDEVSDMADDEMDYE